ncbi:MAG: hypothetical protein IPM45_18285 [Acidimicrobiales bacterium]|nr:hypothetical protein [Acidimicrobiales bacterium]
MPAPRPTVVCLCGSTRFKDAFAAASREETLAGRVVLSVGLFGHSDPALAGECPVCKGQRGWCEGGHWGDCARCSGAGVVFDQGSPAKAMLDRLHLRKIDMADEVLVLNVGGYVGESTAREVAYAEAAGKPVRYLEPRPADAGRGRIANTIREGVR